MTLESNGGADDGTCAIYIDMGTTNTRVWLKCGSDTIARAQAPVGIRDAARAKSRMPICEALRGLIRQVRVEAEEVSVRPSFVIAAGMITSADGVLEVPHVAAPAGLEELARTLRVEQIPEITDLPVMLVPGVKCSPGTLGLDGIGSFDIVRGEETLCVGLFERGVLSPGATLLTLGSHWKAIRLDARGRIQASFTTLSGELIHATQSQTVLASAIPNGPPEELDTVWLDAGMKRERQSGLARALFCVRLLQQQDGGTSEQRLAYLVGAFIASDLDSMITENALTEPVMIAGRRGIASAWEHALIKASIHGTVVREAEVDSGFTEGLRSIAQLNAALRGGC